MELKGVLAIILCFGLTEYCSAEPLRKAFCLEKEGMSELYLSCTAGLLYIRSARQGFQEDQSQECAYQENECSVSYRDAIVASCQGKSECTASARSMMLDPCGMVGNYVQVEYECIPDNSEDRGNVLDVCGDYMQGAEFERTQGYIDSINYPYVYSPSTMCSCNLSTANPNAQIYLHVIDLDLHMQEANGDWLEYTRGVDMWGRGHKLQNDDIGRDIQTGMNRMMINFNSDGRLERRGFWLKYRGVGEENKDEVVKISCGKINPPRFRESVVCFDNTEKRNEIYLSCQSLGVINVLRAHHGYSTAEAREQCVPVKEDRCVVDSLSRYELLKKCMGEIDCVVDVDEVPVPLCSQDSNFFQVYYQCVADVEQFNIIDICGDTSGNEIVLREEGYIESLNYPQLYPPNIQCECSLEATRESAEVILSVLDMKVTDQNTQQCKSDWLEYRKLSQDWGRGTKICEAPVGDSISTKASKVFLNFQTGDDGMGRGFWIKYYGRDKDGARTKVKLQCSSHGRLNVEIPVDTDDDVSTAASPPDGGTINNSASDDIDDELVNRSLIVGLCAIGLLMLIIFLTMVVYKYRLSKNKKPASPGSGVHLPGPLDNGYSTFAGHAPYKNMRDSHSSASSSIKSGPSTARTTAAYSFNEPEPDYADPVHFMHPGAKTGASKAYINPSFNGNLHA